MSNWVPPSFPIDAETFVGTMASVAASHGNAMAVAVLAEAEAAIAFADQRSDWGHEYNYFSLRLMLDAGLYGRLASDRKDLCEALEELAQEISRGYFEDMSVTSVTLAPKLSAREGWRDEARAWLRGEKINNQGRVRSDNIAARQHDGLLFRSQPEIHLYNALKAKGIYLAPLPVFLRGGPTYQRLEPDFVLLHKGVIMVVEIDGATVHRESPAEAHKRTEGLQRDGVHVERVQASECATAQDAQRCAEKLVAALASYLELRG